MCDNFAKLKQTWNSQSSLAPTTWDPYPELMNQNDCGVARESYEQLGNTYAPNGGPTYNKFNTCSSTMPRFTTEQYEPPCCVGNMQYSLLKKTWDTQKRYDL